jgi:hypothetical protein
MVIVSLLEPSSAGGGVMVLAVLFILLKIKGWT